MSKELPFFRFTVSEWLNDDISMESYDMKGLFIDVCSFYWFKDCSITKALLEKRFSDAITNIKVLLKTGIIKVNSNDEISILFLDDQYDMLSEKRKNRQVAGKKGGLQKSSNAKAKLKQKPSYNDKDKDNNKDNNKCIDFVNYCNETIKRNGKVRNWKASIKLMKSFNARLKDGYTPNNFAHAIQSAMSDQFHKESQYKYLTPEFFCRQDKLEKYANL